MSQSSSSIGRIIGVAGQRLTARMLSKEEGYQAYLQLGLEEVATGQLGTHLLVKSKGFAVLTQVLETWEEYVDGRLERHMHLLPLGDVTSDGRFVRGVSQYPPLDAEIYLVSTAQLETMFDSFRRDGLHLGRHSQRQALKVYFDPGRLFSRHFAILGQSGSGKSWTVASILQRTVKTMPNAHVVLLDLHGEYGWRDKQERMHSAFDKKIARHVDARSLEIPYWLLTYAELIDLLIDRNDPNASVQMSFMREVLYNLRRKANREMGIDRLSVDSPVFFSIKEMYLQFKKANELKLDFGKTQGPLFGAFDEFLVRFQGLFNDSRYDFLFKPKKRTESAHLEGLLRDFIGLGQEKAQITVIDLSGIPHDVRPVISAQIGRLAFEFNYWNPRRQEFPILLVCEEAHQYIPRNADTKHEATRREIERIAKEGRKYGVGLCVVSQRPLELSETVLSQCASFICLRISNPDDQAYVRQLMPDGERDLASILASLRRGEALAVGEAVPLPTRFQVYKPDPIPSSNDVDVAQAWREGPSDLDVSQIVQHWWRQIR